MSEQQHNVFLPGNDNICCWHCTFKWSISHCLSTVKLLHWRLFSDGYYKNKGNLKVGKEISQQSAQAVEAAWGAGWDDPYLFSFSAAGQWTNSRLHLLLIDWPVRACQCTCRQNKPCCNTLLTHEHTNLSPPTTRKLGVKWDPLLPSHQPDSRVDRISQDGLIQVTVTGLSELPHAEFWPCVDLYMWVV